MDAMSTLTENGPNDNRLAAAANLRADRAAWRQIKCHTMQSNFMPKSLKTNAGHPRKVTHFFEAAETLLSAVFHESRKVLNG
jgi:hypothetical protein